MSPTAQQSTKNPAGFIQRFRMKSVGFLYFLRSTKLRDKVAFYSLVLFVRKINGVSRGENPLGSGFPIGARSIPVGTRFSVGKSSMLYLLRPLTLERGCPSPDRPFSAAAEQADFVGCKIHKMKDFP